MMIIRSGTLQVHVKFLLLHSRWFNIVHMVLPFLTNCFVVHRFIPRGKGL